MPLRGPPATARRELGLLHVDLSKWLHNQRRGFIGVRLVSRQTLGWHTNMHSHARIYYAHIQPHASLTHKRTHKSTNFCGTNTSTLAYSEHTRQQIAWAATYHIPGEKVVHIEGDVLGAELLTHLQHKVHLRVRCMLTNHFNNKKITQDKRRDKGKTGAFAYACTCFLSQSTIKQSPARPTRAISSNKLGN